ncbi:MAG: hypothetical protein ABEJ70_02800 [Halobacteriaceae archaeon]
MRGHESPVSRRDLLGLGTAGLVAVSAGCLRLTERQSSTTAPSGSGTRDGSGEGTSTRSPTVSGRVESAVGATLEGTVVEVIDDENPRERRRAVLDADGAFEVDLPRTATYRVVYFEETGNDGLVEAEDGVPLLFDLDTVDVSADADLGTFTLPEGYLTDVRFVDGDDNPLEGVPANFRTPSGEGLAPGSFTTTAAGYVEHVGASETGVDLSGDVGVEVQPPGGGRPTALQRVAVTEDTEYTVTVPDPEQYAGVTVHST